MVFFNDGTGALGDSGQSLGSGAQKVALADMNGDGSIDAVTTLREKGSTIWLNDRSGAFTASPANPGPSAVVAICVADVNADSRPVVMLGQID